MNERIQELVEQARKKSLGNSWTYRHYGEFEEKFLELIVQECIQAIRDRTPVIDPEDITEDWDRGYIRAHSDCEDYIKEHFGVDNE